MRAHDRGHVVSTAMRSAALLALVVGMSACGARQTGNTNAAYTDLCGSRIGMNMSVVDASGDNPVTVDGVTAGDVVALRVAPCGHGVEVALDPATGSGSVQQTVRDSQQRVVGLVVTPVLGKVLRIYRTDVTPHRLLASVDIKK
jgi:hypothetical protein